MTDIWKCLYLVDQGNNQLIRAKISEKQFNNIKSVQQNLKSIDDENWSSYAYYNIKISDDYDQGEHNMWMPKVIRVSPDSLEIGHHGPDGWHSALVEDLENFVFDRKYIQIHNEETHRDYKKNVSDIMNDSHYNKFKKYID